MEKNASRDESIVEAGCTIARAIPYLQFARADATIGDGVFRHLMRG
jgi:hypothetical protein